MTAGQPDMAQLLAQAQQMQQKLVQAQADLAEMRIEGHAGGSLVRAVVSGGGELVSLSIDPSVVDPADVDTLADLVVAAVRDAVRQAGAAAEAMMAPVTGALGGSGAFGGLGLPGR